MRWLWWGVQWDGVEGGYGSSGGGRRSGTRLSCPPPPSPRPTQVFPRPAFLREFRRLRGRLPYAAAAAAADSADAADAARAADDGPAPLPPGELLARVSEEDL